MSDKYPLNGTHFTIEDDRQMMQTPADWPWVDQLPVKRSFRYFEPDEPKVPQSVRGGKLFASDIREGTFAVWYFDDDGRTWQEYDSVDDILADGWVVD